MPKRPVTANIRRAWFVAMLLLVALLLYAVANFPALWSEWGPFVLLPFGLLIFFVKMGIDKLYDRPWV